MGRLAVSPDGERGLIKLSSFDSRAIPRASDSGDWAIGNLKSGTLSGPSLGELV
jgi:hypothetical protein